MRPLHVRAPAKINLGLRIVGRRDDGYHLLDSLFVPLALADELTIGLEVGAPGGGPAPVRLRLLDGEGPPGVENVPCDDTNLAVRAARAFLAAAGPAERVRGVRIDLRKRIPAGAGLGGGSSDAGAVLRSLAKVLPGGVAGPELAAIALGLGADVPFFLDPRPARVRGIGERIEPFEGLPRLAVVLANPGISLSTAEVYRRTDERGPVAPGGLTAPDPGSTMRALSGLGGDPNSLSRLPGFTNDLEPAAESLCPEVGRLRDRLRAAGAIQAGMSGSGATVYGLFASEAEASEALGRADLPAETWTCVTRFETGDPAEPSEPSTTR